MSLCDGRVVYERLRSALPRPRPERFVALYARGEGGLFPLLVAVVLSQNTSDRNAIEAYRRLREALGGVVTPEAVLRLSVDELVEAIKPAGMYKRRAEVIRRIAEWLVENRGVEERLCKLGVEEARKLLMSLPGVGPKTADVVLMHYCGFDLFPVDTHISRILERWGVRGGYEEKRRWGESFFPRGVRREAHMLLIELGRVYCRPGRPRCEECPLRDCCPYAQGVEARGGASSAGGDSGEGGRS